MQHVSFDFTIDTLAAIILFNIVGTALQYALVYIHERKKWEWSERALKVINFLLTMVAILIANKHRPMMGLENAETLKTPQSKS